MESTCLKCDGTGWTVVERNGLSGAKRCTCYQAARSISLQESAGIPLNYENASLDNFIITQKNPITSLDLTKALLAMRRYVENFPAALEKPGLLLVGGTGAGKTHLAVGVLRALIANGYEGVFYDYQGLLDRIRMGWDVASGTSDRAAYGRALDSQILVLDELGAHRLTEWVQDIITAIITHRCNNRLATIITTNLTPDEPLEVESKPGSLSIRPPRTLGEVIGLRARSRLFEMCKIVKMPAAQDYREANAR